MPPRSWCSWPVFFHVELPGVPWFSQLLLDAHGAVLQQPLGSKLEECVRPELPVLHLHTASWSVNIHIYIHRRIRALLFITNLFPADSQFSPIVRGGLLGSIRAPQSSATCMLWGGSHYRSFDRKHFHFQGSCTYLLAASTDGTWAVYISTVCEGGRDCSKVCLFCPVNRNQVSDVSQVPKCIFFTSGFKDDVWPRFGVNTSKELDT